MGTWKEYFAEHNIQYKNISDEVTSQLMAPVYRAVGVPKESTGDLGSEQYRRWLGSWSSFNALLDAIPQIAESRMATLADDVHADPVAGYLIDLTGGDDHHIDVKNEKELINNLVTSRGNVLWLPDHRRWLFIFTEWQGVHFWRYPIK